MKYQAQDVLNAFKLAKPGYPFGLDDAQKVLDASPKSKKIGKCHFSWDDDNGSISIKCPDEPKNTLEHPDSLKRLSEKLNKALKKKLKNPKNLLPPSKKVACHVSLPIK